MLKFLGKTVKWNGCGVNRVVTISICDVMWSKNQDLVVCYSFFRVVIHQEAQDAMMLSIAFIHCNARFTNIRTNSDVLRFCAQRPISGPFESNTKAFPFCQKFKAQKNDRKLAKTGC